MARPLLPSSSLVISSCHRSHTHPSLHPCVHTSISPTSLYCPISNLLPSAAPKFTHLLPLKHPPPSPPSTNHPRNTPLNRSPKQTTTPTQHPHPKPENPRGDPRSPLFQSTMTQPLYVPAVVYRPTFLSPSLALPPFCLGGGLEFGIWGGKGVFRCWSWRWRCLGRVVGIGRGNGWRWAWEGGGRRWRCSEGRDGGGARWK